MDAFDAVEDFAAHFGASSRILTQDKSPTASAEKASEFRFIELGQICSQIRTLDDGLPAMQTRENLLDNFSTLKMMIYSVKLNQLQTFPKQF